MSHNPTAALALTAAEKRAADMRETRRLFDVRAMTKDATAEYYEQAGAAHTPEGREFWLNQVKRAESNLAEILAA